MAKRQAATLELVPVADLRPDAANIRKHDQRSIDAIAASLREFGQQKPIVATRDGTVIAGNGLLAAATAIGLESVLVMRTELDAAAIKRYAIADNRVAELSEWDFEALHKAIADMGDDSLPGIDEQFVRELDAIVVGMTADAMDDGDYGDEEVPRRGATLRVSLYDEAMKAQVKEAVARLLAEHPEWKASVE